MRCPHCDTPNDDDAATCIQCAQPLTAYVGSVTGGPTRSTLSKIERASDRPPIVGLVAALDAVVAVFGPFAVALRALLAARSTAGGEEAYVFHAIGAASGFVVGIVMVPPGLFLLWLARATLTQSGWAWMANTLLLGLGAVTALLALGSSPAGAIVRLGICIGVAYYWFRPEARAWFGVDRG